MECVVTVGMQHTHQLHPPSHQTVLCMHCAAPPLGRQHTPATVSIIANNHVCVRSITSSCGAVTSGTCVASLASADCKSKSRCSFCCEGFGNNGLGSLVTCFNNSARGKRTVTDDCRSTRSALENACVQSSLCELASSLPCPALPCSVHGWAHSLTHSPFASMM